MKCFYFHNKNKKELEPKSSKSISIGSLSTSLSTDPDMRRSGSESHSQNVSEFSTQSSSAKAFAVLSQKQSNLKEFTFAELKTATKNFSRSLMIGEGGFGGVYKGITRSTVDSTKKIEVAGHKEWVTEVNVLGIVEHPNLVKLLGYCAEDDERGIQRLLIYEYMPNRSVQDHLSSRYLLNLTTVMCVMTWLEKLIIFRDFKSSNILLDQEWNAKLSDFGLARLGPSDGLSHVSTAVVGTIGYAAPEYIQTGRLTSKSDVWSYGVFLYELITGRRPLDRNKPRNEQKLLEWIRPHLSDSKKFELILDPRLERKYSLKAAKRLASVANRCLVRQPKSRPKMSEVLDILNRIMQTTDMGSPPQTPLKSLPLDDETRKSKREMLKKHVVDPIFGERGCLMWQAWRPKIVKT
uniref:Protein kinase domain-containing protein n=1 Tax=Cannabis sativa TaxID=3483 RepID=A0A803P2M9_CANSA